MTIITRKLPSASGSWWNFTTILVIPLTQCRTTVKYKQKLLWRINEENKAGITFCTKNVFHETECVNPKFPWELFFRKFTVGIDIFTILVTTLLVINKHIVKVIGKYAVCAVRSKIRNVSDNRGYTPWLSWVWQTNYFSDLESHP